MYADLRNQRGSALVITILALLVVTLLAGWMMFAANQEARL